MGDVSEKNAGAFVMKRPYSNCLGVKPLREWYGHAKALTHSSTGFERIPLRALCVFKWTLLKGKDMFFCWSDKFPIYEERMEAITEAIFLMFKHGEVPEWDLI